MMAGDLIVVVDDDRELLQASSAMLEQAGFRVLTATNAAAGFKLLERRLGVALLITDIVMPGLDGLMLADMIKLRHPAVRVVYVTGHVEEVERQPGYRYGPVLEKPFRAAQLEAVVRDALARPADRFGFRPDSTGTKKRCASRA